MSNTQNTSLDVIIIGSGIGGLTAGALLARYGKKVLICESHSIPGGAAHSFSRQGFKFDSGPSFYCGLGNQRPSLNPLKQVLDLIGESLDVVPYDPLGFYHFPDVTLPIYSDLNAYRQAIAKITPGGAIELERFENRLLSLYDCLKDIPSISLRSDWQILPLLVLKYGGSLIKFLPQLSIINGSVGQIMDQYIQDPWVRRLIDLECFLLSGLKAQGTIAPEVAFMLGERNRAGVEYPKGGSEAIVNALVRGFKRWGGELRLKSHVDKILVEKGKVAGIKLNKGEIIKAKIVISNASLWDTYSQLLNPEDLPADYRVQSLKTPTVESFMHLHLGIKSDGLEGLTGHHVVVHDERKDISEPGNTCMISIPSVWDKTLAPEGHHVIHAYTLEPWQGWERNEHYEEKKKERSQSLYKALEKVIPDIRQRVTLELIGTPLTHAYYLRRYQGTYGPAIAAENGLFPSCYTPISGLYRVGDSTLPGIGVPAVAASGILCANTLVPLAKIWELIH
ncbi:FAD dependent oxidoreductase [Gloeothece citriformis PCC 7424]|uniref:FAD dependent oxidoreductase n=1 Tax=Gloeothece citriformis (strain PCC 7424) TaxID=65393 RepID=B7KHS1_GLOC7|nr:NAD(P)/FAD-dependent oxidoreductase [Gloeothece citriformis]ACK72018.1 FAD dependent oxidoreductase [Gloeothece citriformis PCC 7424]